jgi:hypothetical protein
MFTCRSCMQRHFQSILDGPIPHRVRQYSRPAGPKLKRHDQRDFSLATAQFHSGYHLDAEPREYSKSRSVQQNSQLSENQVSGKTSSSKRDEWLKSRGVTPEHKRTKKDQRDYQRELIYLKDPLKLAIEVRHRLTHDGDFEAARDLVREASRDIQCTVSWNHLIDWQMSQNRVNAAIKTFNEV